MGYMIMLWMEGDRMTQRNAAFVTPKRGTTLAAAKRSMLAWKRKAERAGHRHISGICLANGRFRRIRSVKCYYRLGAYEKFKQR